MKIIKVDSRNGEKIAKEASKFIKEDKVIICPTDTVYGLLCNAISRSAVAKIFRIKKRPKGKFVPIFVRDLKQAKKLAKINKEQEIFLKKNWPGKITVILERNNKKLYGVDKKTVALRMPKHKMVNYLSKTTNLPLVGTSANISGKPASTKIKGILEQFKNRKNKPDLVIDAGTLKFSKPSRIIDLTAEKPKILRK